jgi:D-beta-D-heptose 7-phosphate kinase/D-beta-D-heptose 1-phosphate adenosyltransferase
MPQDNSKIVPPIILAKKVKILKKQGKTIVFTNGCYDLLHVGHVRILKKAKKIGNILIVALNTDSSVRKIKGKERPIVPLRERMEILSALGNIDYVTYFAEETPEKIIKILEPDILVKGGDYKISEIVGAEHIEKKGGKVVIIPFFKGKSTTGILKKIKKI